MTSLQLIEENFHGMDPCFFAADNRRKVRNAMVRAPDFAAFMRPSNHQSSSKISAQMKVAVLQFLSTSNYPQVR